MKNLVLRTPLTVVSLLLGLGLVACGDDDGGTSSAMESDGGMLDDDDTGSSDDDTASDDDDDRPGPAGDDDKPAGDDDESAGDDDRPAADDDTPAADDDVPADDDTTAADDDTTAGDDDVPAEGDIDALIAAICEWEFNCCDAGEIDFRFGPSVTDAADCTETFIFELHESNVSSNPYVAGSGAALLGTLGYVVNLDRVEPNPEGIAECLEVYQNLGCNEEVEVATSCGGPAQENPCALSNLFNPVLELDDRCTLALAEGAENDIECLPGSSCLDSTDPDNSNNFPACVRRRVEGEPCAENADCDFGFYCNADGDCTEKGDVGDPCSFEDPDAPVPGEEFDLCKPGLSCHPEDFVCVSDCAEDFTCTSDWQCPDGMSCAPVTIGSDTTSFHQCRPLGTGTQRCDDDADCIETRHCAASGNCTADFEADTGDCTRHSQCVEGTYCDSAGTGKCAAELLPNADCNFGLLDASGGYGDKAQCGPDAVGCFVIPTRDTDGYYYGVEYKCKTARLNEGAICYPYGILSRGMASHGSDCKVGKCEAADAEDTTFPYRCVPGGEVGDPCDDDLTSPDLQSCGPGLLCRDGECVAQIGPGSDCEDDGAADPAICANSDCREQWEGFMCGDTPVPKSAGGSNVTCDGQ